MKHARLRNITQTYPIHVCLREPLAFLALDPEGVFGLLLLLLVLLVDGPLQVPAEVRGAAGACPLVFLEGDPSPEGGVGAGRGVSGVLPPPEIGGGGVEGPGVGAQGEEEFVGVAEDATGKAHRGQHHEVLTT